MNPQQNNSIFFYTTYFLLFFIIFYPVYFAITLAFDFITGHQEILMQLSLGSKRELLTEILNNWLQFSSISAIISLYFLILYIALRSKPKKYTAIAIVSLTIIISILYLSINMKTLFLPHFSTFLLLSLINLTLILRIQQ